MSTKSRQYGCGASIRHFGRCRSDLPLVTLNESSLCTVDCWFVWFDAPHIENLMDILIFKNVHGENVHRYFWAQELVDLNQIHWWATLSHKKINHIIIHYIMEARRPICPLLYFPFDRPSSMLILLNFFWSERIFNMFIFIYILLFMKYMAYTYNLFRDYIS